MLIFLLFRLYWPLRQPSFLLQNKSQSALAPNLPPFLRAQRPGLGPGPMVGPRSPRFGPPFSGRPPFRPGLGPGRPPFRPPNFRGASPNQSRKSSLEPPVFETLGGPRRPSQPFQPPPSSSPASSWSPVPSPDPLGESGHRQEDVQDFKDYDWHDHHHQPLQPPRQPQSGYNYNDSSILDTDSNQLLQTSSPSPLLHNDRLQSQSNSVKGRINCNTTKVKALISWTEDSWPDCFNCILLQPKMAVSFSNVSGLLSHASSTRYKAH